MLKDRAAITRRESLRASRRLVKLSKAHRRESLADAREELREETEAIRAMVRAELAGDLAHNHSGHIDHTPGGSPSPYPPAAPAPDRTYHPARTLRPIRERVAKDRVSFSELVTRSGRAARQAMRGSAWSHSDRQDAQSYAIERVLVKTAERVGGDVSKLSDVPADLASGVALYRLARDCRVSKVRDADRDQADAISRVFSTVPDPEDTPGEVAPDVTRYPIHALRFAWDACESLGVASTGETFTIAYTVARMVSGVADLGKTKPEDQALAITQADVARELGIAPATHRSILHRARAKYPAAHSKSYRAPKRIRTRGDETVAAFLDALSLLDNPQAGTQRVTGAGIPERVRGLTTKAPVSPAPTVTRTRVYFRRTAADWTRELTPRQRQAMHAASVMRQSRQGIPETKQVKSPA